MFGPSVRRFAARRKAEGAAAGRPDGAPVL
jgi:hypothetical protein